MNPPPARVQDAALVDARERLSGYASPHLSPWKSRTPPSGADIAALLGYVERLEVAARALLDAEDDLESGVAIDRLTGVLRGE